MKSDWDPSLYRQFENERTRPAHELLTRITLERPNHITDLGCGPGNSTALLAQKWPAAKVVGLDNSPAMLEQAVQRLPQCAFELANISTWRARQPQDLIYANASLQWLTQHEQLMPHLLAQLAPGGVLAIQMPDNLQEPSHRAMRDVAGLPQFSDKISDATSVRAELLSTEGYYDLLTTNEATADIWRTTYYHVMPSVDAIIDWLRATGLRPFLAPLSAQEQAQFLSLYRRELTQHYPLRANGTVLLAFPRLFLVATRGG
ncbi:trans-aconitate 2-methyltransferase [Duffyella gerundensis]|uniref:trans-aconitate 2-methyltransferase n=1 Tax=Duffyella gerundensis TaxID=1619313 RepID=UPI0016544D32|nr:trans-aconitate 2-methyltransferase [Duffyella gerundensis]